ncbi:MAG TPA: PQQ-binding-like beta-propeller repeat protein [Candidatus Polarisedimenticolaceae bacterium]|nr:PQQ-binding-like beta-propeller repeat protein [Candidatus Polarisedimenticolaceae bacterium]
MARRASSVLALVATGMAIAAVPAADTDAGNWPQFRGPGARGVADGHELPASWNVEDGTRVKWKTAIPGLGHSSPVVWGDAIFVTTAISGKPDPELKVGLYGNIDAVEDDTEHRYRLYRLDRNTGSIVWERTVHQGVPEIKRHTKSSHANPSPTTDGKYVAAFFGSEGLYVFDTEGKSVWNQDFGSLDSGYFQVPAAQWGFGSSPVIHDGRVIIQADVQQGSFLAALALATGDVIWKTVRQDVPTWSTPTVHVGESRSQVLVNGFKQIGGYDLDRGELLWSMRGTGDIPVPTPYVADGLVFLTSAHGPGSPIYAIRPTARGDVTLGEGQQTNDHVVWSRRGGGSYMPTTLVYRGLLYVLRDNGVLTVYRALDGEQQYQQRLGTGSSGFTASLVAGDGKVYATAETGEVYVVKAGAAFELSATNEMGEICMATPAISRGMIFYRTKDHLVALGD